MTGRIVLAALAGAVASFIWGAVYFAMLPSIAIATRSTSMDSAVYAAAKAELPETGTYLYPPIPEDQGQVSEEQVLEQHRAGPLMMVQFRKEGVNPVSPRVFGMGFLLYFAGSLVAALLLSMARLDGFGARVAFVSLLGLVPALARLSEPVWFHAPWAYPLMYAIGDLTTWIAASLAIAAIIRRRSTAQAAAYAVA
ncbi:MAG TPA: hypothetical protein VED40_11085 [Azospirillaceae bacterium]|nr:hypothetical protein [Azospirillaceae bacterium]